jgi:drug/metabolite transporter (DMT)-like permease
MLEDTWVFLRAVRDRVVADASIIAFLEALILFVFAALVLSSPQLSLPIYIAILLTFEWVLFLVVIGGNQHREAIPFPWWFDWFVLAGSVVWLVLVLVPNGAIPREIDLPLTLVTSLCLFSGIVTTRRRS